MEILRFTDQYDFAAPLYGLEPDELRQRDHGSDPSRWLAVTADGAVAACDSFERPDRRTFLRFAGAGHDAHAALATAAGRDLGRRVFAVVDEANREQLNALRDVGFSTEVVGERFRIGFDRALDWLRHARPPGGFTMRSADGVDEDRLFTLDNAIRNDVPGSDGWRGDRDWFRDEFSERPPFDPETYLVASDDTNGEYVGLVRIWRNRSGPRLGLVGVLRQYRGTPVAPALLRQSLSAAARWGHEDFATETSPSNKHVYPRMRRLGAVSEGRFHQLVRRRGL